MTRWSEPTRALWGKFDPETGEWMPLVRHLEDAADVAGLLWDEWLSPGMKIHLTELFGNEDVAKSGVRFLAGIHDLGKAAIDFQKKASSVPGAGHLYSRVKLLGFDFPPKMDERTLQPHGLLGQVAAEEFLSEAGVPPEHARSVAGIIGSHHGRPVKTPYYPGAFPGLGKGQWEVSRREIWEGMAAHVGFVPAQHLRVEMPAWAQVQLNAVVVMADWMASNVDLFPYEEEIGLDRLASAMDMLDLPTQWRPRNIEGPIDDIFVAQFPDLANHAPTALQRAAVEAARAMPSPSLLVLEAPMGDGKTEAALMAASVLAHRFGQRGVMFALPTMATSNPMFGRVLAWLQATSEGGRTTLNLVHGKAALNDDYSALMRGRLASVFDGEEPAKQGPEVYVSSWFTGRRRAVLADHVVGTIDQVLFGGLRAKHVMLRQFALAGKVIVIDEVHAADDFMRAYLETVLSWLGQHAVPVVLLSATLPPEVRSGLCAAYTAGILGRSAVDLHLDDEVKGTRVTVAGCQVANWAVPQPTTQKVVELAPLPDSEEALVNLVRESLADGGCMAIICNTVARAQNRYRALKAAGIEDVLLVHSKFVAPHRAAREAELVSQLGRSGERPRRLVVVGTQVLEQSLDVDFDVMVTDIAPMDLLLQRIGRLHRHDRRRPARLVTSRVYVAGVEEWSAPVPRFVPVIERVYPRWLLLSTLAVLGRLPGSITLPQGIAGLVAQAMDMSRPGPTAWSLVWDAALVKYQAHRDQQRRDAAAFTLALPTARWALASWSEPVAHDPESPRGAGRAAVRDTDESLEVVVVQGDGAGNAVVMDGVGEYSRCLVPRPMGERDHRLAKAVSSCTVALPALFTADPAVLDATIAELESYPAEAWQSSPWLAGRLILELDQAGEARLVGRLLRYDTELGLRVVGPEGPERSPLRRA